MRRPTDRGEVADRKEHHHFTHYAFTFRWQVVDQQTAHEQGGTTAPESVFPPPFLRFSVILMASSGGDLASDARSSTRFPMSASRRMEASNVAAVRR